MLRVRVLSTSFRILHFPRGNNKQIDYNPHCFELITFNNNNENQVTKFWKNLHSPEGNFQSGSKIKGDN